MLIEALIIMTVTISLDTREFVDLMNPPRLYNANDIILSQDRERDDFVRTVEDVKLRVSDQDNELTNMFRKYPITSKWEVNIYDEGRQLFRGRVAMPIISDVKGDWLEIRAFSKNKDFWDKAKVTRIRKKQILQFIFFSSDFSSDLEQGWMYVKEAIQMNCNRFIDEGLFDGYDIDEFYRYRQIRALNRITAIEGVFATIPDYNYYSLIRSTTVFDFLTALSIYYNAEIFIDPETNKLTMRQRNKVQNDKEYDLDNIIINNERIVFDNTDQKKYDFILTGFNVDKPKRIISYPYNESPINTRFEGVHIEDYCYTNVYSNGIESEPSDPGGYSYEDSDQSGQRWKFACVLPIPPSNVIQQNVYVKTESKKFYKVIELNVSTNYNTPTIKKLPYGILFVDEISTIAGLAMGLGRHGPGRNSDWLATNPQQLSELKPTGEVYWRYDETTGAWTSLSGYQDELAPGGRIFSPQLSLIVIDRDGNTKQLDTYAVFYFFNSESNISTFAQQWLDFFITKGKVYCTVKGLAYRIGDSFVTSKHPKIPAGKYVVKKARGYLMKERTELELIQV